MLVDYENSDNGESSGDDEDKGEVATATTTKGGDDDAATNTTSSTESDNDGEGDDLAAMAAADDTVEEALRMRVPESATAAPPATKTRTPVLPPNPHLARLVAPRPGGKRRLNLLADADDNSDDEDEDAIKRRSVAVAVAAAASGRGLRGGTSLLARLPQPRAPLASGKRPRQTQAAAFTSAATSTSTANSTARTTATTVEDEVETQPERLQEQRDMLGAILPPRELSRYRQATGASLTAEVGDSGIVEIRQADQMAGSDLLLAKELTRNAGADPRRKPAGPAPNSMSKRKHQITYLAYQAQERELELKNSWSDARFSQRSSQNKYGF